jgi:hypothetical protein
MRLLFLLYLSATEVVLSLKLGGNEVFRSLQFMTLPKYGTKIAPFIDISKQKFAHHIQPQNKIPTRNFRMGFYPML